MKKRVCLAVFVVLSASMHIHGQPASGNPSNERSALTQKKYTFAIQPFQFFNSGLRLDFEMRLGDGPGWLQVGPAVYFSSEDGEPNYYYDGRTYHYTTWDTYFYRKNAPFTEMRGAGLDVNYKRFINPRRSFYVAAGLSYTHFNIKYRGWTWSDFIEDGLEYHSYTLGYNNQHINRIGANGFFGYQIPSRRAFVFDVFWGVAYRHSFSDNDKPAFNKSMFSYGWTGCVFLCGVRLGFGMK